jgi:1-acyl-sn-glycerol-3-phosphate acyltransferase
MPEKPVFVRGRLSSRGVARLQRLFAALYSLFATVEVRGLEHLPPGGVVITPNHNSRFDAPLIFFSLPAQRKMTLFNADSYRRNPFFRWVLESVDVIWVNRGATSPATIKAALHALRGGSILGIAPEGTRSPTGALLEGKTGAAFLALAAGVPVVPCALTGVEKLGAAIRRLRRVKLTVTYGPAFLLAPPGKRGRSDPEQLEAATTEIMCRLAALLPPQYRGVYADHPRLKELVAEAKAATEPQPAPSA